MTLKSNAKLKPVLICLPERLWARVKIQSTIEGRPARLVVHTALRRYMDEKNTPQPKPILAEDNEDDNVG